MKLEYIKSNGKVYRPVEPKTEGWGGLFIPVCYIKKMSRGRWQVDTWDIHASGYGSSNQEPNTRIILYPSGIEEIKYNQS